MGKLLGKEKEVIKKYLSGLSGVCLAREYGVGKQTVYRLLNDLKITVRNNQEAHDILYADNSILSKYTLDAINGWLLGDGSIAYSNTKQASFSLTTKYLEYAEYVKNIISKDIKCSISTYNGKGRLEYIVFTKYAKCFKQLRDKWYPSGIKIVPQIEITPITLSNWIMDDGSLDKNHSTIHLYSCAFSKNDNYFLIDKLKNITNNEHISLVNIGKYPYIYCSRKAARKIIEYIGKCPVNCFNYKWLNDQRIDGGVSF